MGKRRRFVLVSLVLALGLVVTQWVGVEYRYQAVAMLGGLSYGLCAWALREDLRGIEWLMALLLPALYPVSVGLFYFLLPQKWFSEVAILGLFGVGMYALLLTGNIYSVAKGRTIQLIHAAHAIGQLFTLLTSLLLTNTVFSFHLPFWSTMLLVGIIHWPLIFMSLWSINLEQRITHELLSLSSLLTLILVEFSLILSFLPISVWNCALLIMSLMYLGLGLLHNYLRGVLFDNAIREYSLVGILMGIVLVMVFPWK